MGDYWAAKVLGSNRFVEAENTIIPKANSTRSEPTRKRIRAIHITKNHKHLDFCLVLCSQYRAYERCANWGRRSRRMRKGSGSRKGIITVLVSLAGAAVAHLLLERDQNTQQGGKMKAVSGIRSESSTFYLLL